MKKKYLAFTLMEIMIAILIVAILASIAIPSYMNYTRRSAYSAIVSIADRYKVSVAACIDYNSGVATNCNGGSNSIPANISGGTAEVNSVTVAAGVISIVPNAKNGLTASLNYVATPAYNSSTGVTWTISGGVCGTGYISDC